MTTNRESQRRARPVVGAASKGGTIAISMELHARMLEALEYVVRPDGPGLTRAGKQRQPGDFGPSVEQLLQLEAELRAARSGGTQ